MYKSKLQEFCQQRQWKLPNYSLSRDGPAHQPRFKASVLVNGDSFDCPDFCKSSKEAQSEAARIALHHFSSPHPVDSSSVSTSSSSTSSTGLSNAITIMRNSPSDEGNILVEHKEVSHTSPSHGTASVVKDDNDFGGLSNAITITQISPSGEGNILGKHEEVSHTSPSHGTASVVKDDNGFGDVLYLCKGQLQIYAQKRNLSLPVYSCMREGSSHAPRFKAVVAVDGQSFESPEFCRTLREAENAAAKVAFSSLSKDGIQEDGCALYKNYLQELAQKEGFSTPSYMTTLSGASHVPTFTSTVEVEGDVFHGVAARTKKQAELNAAKVAYFSLKERQSKRIPAPLSHSGDAHGSLESFFSGLHSGVTVVPAPLPQSGDAKVSLENVFPSSHSGTSAVPVTLPHSGDAHGSLENFFSGLHSGVTVVPAPLPQSGDAKVSLENVFPSSHSGISAVPVTLPHSGDEQVSLENAFSRSHSAIAVVPAPLSHSGNAHVSLEKVFSSSHSGVNVVRAPLSNSGNAQVSVENVFSSSHSGVTVVSAPLSHSGDAQVSLENAFLGSHSGITFVPAPLSHSGNAPVSLKVFSSSHSGVNVVPAHVSLEKVFSSSHSGINTVPAPLSNSGNAQVSVKNVFSSSNSGITVLPAPLSHSDVAQVSLGNAFSGSHSCITFAPAPLSHGGDAQVSLEKVFSSSHSGINVVPAPLSHSNDAQGSLEIVSGSHSGITIAFQQKLNLGDTDQEAPSDEIITRKFKASADQSTTSLLGPGINSEQRIKDTSSLDVIYENPQVPVPSVPSPEFGTSSPTTVLEGSNFSVAESNRDLLAEEGALLCNRVMVYPRKPTLEFPKGTTLIPITDDHWVAVKLEYPNE